ncbi:DUF2306 domain-containing protein [Burkholderia sp. LMG 32019]|uniref:DUF2306 domain-containing protein n=1 Tax=Burkholderia sp. LMG 32019 TaxID=3158173 RepID=UPI003C2B7A97
MKNPTYPRTLPRSAQSSGTSSRLRTGVIGLFTLFAIAMGLFGLIAVETGHLNLITTSSSSLLSQRLAIQQTVDAGQVVSLHQAFSVSGWWMYLMAAVTGQRSVFGSNSFWETMVYYAQMPRSNNVILSFHSMLGGMCMTFGALQFWPALRRNYPRWHRGAGLFYMITAQLAMIMSMIYMARTPVARIYDTITFVTGLWFLAIGVTLTLWMSIFHLVRREYAQHQAYMSINYGLLLTAPFTRIDWTWAALTYPGISQDTSNYAATAVLIAQCLLLGYLLLCMNRWLQQSRPVTQVRPALPPTLGRAISRTGVVALGALCVAGLLTVANHYLVAPGLDQYAAGKALLPQGLIAFQSRVLGHAFASRWIYAITAIGACVITPILFYLAFWSGQAYKRNRVFALATLLGLFAAVNGLTLLHWSVLLGGPTTTSVSGGAPYMMNGASELFFAVLLLSAVLRQRDVLVKEWSVFAIACVLALPSFYGFLPVFGWLYGVLAVPYLQHYIEIASLYRVALTVGLITSVLIASVYAVYGSATQEKFAR